MIVLHSTMDAKMPHEAEFRCIIIYTYILATDCCQTNQFNHDNVCKRISPIANQSTQFLLHFFLNIFEYLPMTSMVTTELNGTELPFRGLQRVCMLINSTGKQSTRFSLESIQALKSEQLKLFNQKPTHNIFISTN